MKINGKSASIDETYKDNDNGHYEIGIFKEQIMPEKL